MIISTESHQFILRAHIYQARSLFGSDDTGLSGNHFISAFFSYASDLTNFSINEGWIKNTLL